MSAEPPEHAAVLFSKVKLLESIPPQQKVDNSFNTMLSFADTITTAVELQFISDKGKCWLIPLEL